MRFIIVSAGWQCAEFMERTMASVEAQTLTNWVHGIVYDPSDDDGADIIRAWQAKDPDRRLAVINTEKKFAIRNHFETITKLDPQDDDVIVFLDLDGDQLAHPRVLERLRDAYAAGALVTYGQYRPIPDMGTSGLAYPYPAAVVAHNGYREHHLNHGETCFNHLRTISGRVFKAIPEAMFKWESRGSTRLPNGDHFGWQAGEWYQGSTDYVFMISALELAGGRYKCFDEVLLLYNHANPLADNKTHPQEAHVCIRNFFGRKPLAPLPAVVALSEKDDLPPSKIVPEGAAPVSHALGPSRRPSGWTEVFLSAEVRREILRDVGADWGLDVFIETGTSDGGTPLFLRDHFRELHTIELGRDQYEAAVRLFRPYPQVLCYLGDSTVVLPRVLAQIDAPALVWLDGHYCGPGSAHGATSTPIREELRVLLEDERPHVILVDDARIFDGGPEHGMYDHYAEYPSLRWVEEYAAAHRYAYALQDDIIRLTPT